uniref:Uncharacterized protein n=1 Tax=Rhizophora mucronata TaxID=61149 RepID=A0A2P2M010_RHIMU
MAGPIETNTMNPDADYSHSQFKGKDNVQLGGLDSRVPESEYQVLLSLANAYVFDSQEALN